MSSLLPHATASATQFTEAWLENRRLSDHTRDAYRRDVTTWLTWCTDRNLDPLAATFLDVNAYARGLEARPMAAATVARKLSGLSSWYAFLVKLRVITGNPVADNATLELNAPESVDVIVAVAASPRAIVIDDADEESVNVGLKIISMIGCNSMPFGAMPSCPS